ncbi:hypothetical protein F7725_017721 [Dissostichus mawsoni]|uniref:Uncharacterized protein n=1 Tax=Dissostichus mawsoni TaxID=36200 RepID=A0A7J5XPI4_DISMA|nr:hypothetical protein F7725_017721 [Dissostichus mawsoni]
MPSPRPPVRGHSDGFRLEENADALTTITDHLRVKEFIQKVVQEAFQCIDDNAKEREVRHLHHHVSGCDLQRLQDAQAFISDVDDRQQAVQEQRCGAKSWSSVALLLKQLHHIQCHATLVVILSVRVGHHGADQLAVGPQTGTDLRRRRAQRRLQGDIHISDDCGHAHVHSSLLNVQWERSILCDGQSDPPPPCVCSVKNEPVSLQRAADLHLVLSTLTETSWRSCELLMKHGASVTHLRVCEEALRFTVHTVSVMNVQLTVGGECDVHSTSRLQDAQAFISDVDDRQQAVQEQRCGAKSWWSWQTAASSELFSRTAALLLSCQLIGGGSPPKGPSCTEAPPPEP